ncbi:hypothetical protein BDA99DRAFT_431543, partial [Phascolomyces articulosus]
IYLGCALIQTKKQLDIFLDNLLSSLQNAYAIHSQQRLSIPGCAAILNSLTSSRLWHV